MSDALPEPEVTEAPELLPYWDGLREGVLRLPRCTRCGLLIWYPRVACPACMSPEVAWERLSGRGTVYSYTVNHRGTGPYRAHSPYVVAYVELAEGPRMLTNVVGAAGDVRVGAPVELVVAAGTGGRTVHPRFRLAGER